jgi:hypothetical protein
MKFKTLLLCLALALPSAYSAEPAPNAALDMTVYRSPSCGCCGKWIAYMKQQGFNIKEIQTEDMDSIKRKLGVPKALESCHTAVVDHYVVEGHVPAEDVRKLLLDKPKALGLAAPGMPMGSPGMEMGGRKDKFSILLFDQQGNADKFNEHN